MQRKGFLLFIIMATFLTIGCNPKEILHRPKSPSETPNNIAKSSMEQPNEIKTTSFFDISAQSIDGDTVSMSQFKGKKIIILNVASECGYTPQYGAWENFYKANSDKVVVLGFPCNQFGGQESGSNTEIKSFCQKNYGVSFPMFDKIDVKGKSQSPIYAWLSDKNQNGWCEKVPTWNFCKYLIDENGVLLDFFASGIEPTNEEFLKEFGTK